ncbi:MAG: hypothetical protein ABL998_06690 [Planctomycetota bacterium]
MPRTFLPLAPALATLFTTGCTVTSVGAEDAPPRVEADGLIEGHAAFGFRDEDRFLRLDVLDGSSDGAVAEFTLWRLFRLELGALGLGVGIGPFDVALGTLFYEPEVPHMVGEASSKAQGEDPSRALGTSDDCEICRKARENSAPR